MIVFEYFWHDPSIHVDTVGDGFKVDFFAADVMIVGDFGMESGDTILSFRQFDSDSAEFHATIFELFSNPVTESDTFDVGEYETFELI